LLFRDQLLQKSKWEKLHENSYHPSVEGAIARIIDAKKKDIWLFDEWSNMLQMELNVQDKTVLEIGCGGGWYLAQMLYRGASKVIGFEISLSILNKVKTTFNTLNLTGYELYEVNEQYLKVLPEKSVDIIFEITVFQHIAEKVTRNYLKASKSVLKGDGVFLCQFLMNDKNPLKRPYSTSEGIVYYSHAQVVKMIDDCGLTIQTYSDYAWRGQDNSYWRLYALKIH
jgi:cyclopropane fatty-acyl-phospholipid synthase-like methyltransferase